MPLYEYHCDECQEDFEKLVSLSECDVNPRCPACGSLRTRRQISKFATRGSSPTWSLSSPSASSGCSSKGSLFS
ncbi:zinc ribbon domain-containing protein [Anaerolinea sp.]|uniref:FmdB family zinc ribbon protein n=1 Tax=Anaerolinea sp. TaxID=1872519 RepID=UPI002ACD7B04|nr:zinc ribbon domain-containing protein [Anaerolinea sp.]